MRPQGAGPALAARTPGAAVTVGESDGCRVGAGGRGSLYEIRRRRRWSSRDLDFRRVDLRHPEPPSGRRLTGQAQAHQPAAGELTVVKLSLMKRKAPTAIVHYAADAADGCYMYALSRRGSATQQCGCTVAAWRHEARERALSHAALPHRSHSAEWANYLARPKPERLRH
jgi:hypothetical protein